MRSTLGSLASIGLLVLGCGDDAGPGGSGTTTTTTTTTDASTSVGDTTDGDTEPTAGSSSGDTMSADESSSTGPVIECGNDVIEADEICDGTDVGEETCQTQGFDDGELGCAADCSGYDTRGCLTAVCGDGVAVGPELCDGPDTGKATCATEGFDSGTLTCLEDCASFDTAGCGICGNNQIDGAEACDGVWLFDDCFTQGFDSGEVTCAADCSVDTSGCGLCGNDIVDGTETCDGADLLGSSCVSLGFTAGDLACTPSCATFDYTGCGVQQFEVSAPTSSATQMGYFRGNGYIADGDGILTDFDVYLDLPAACDLDFYVFEGPAFGGPHTQVARTTVNAGPGPGYYAAGIPLVPVTNGLYYILGVGWNCPVTYFWDSTGTYAGADGGIGLFHVGYTHNGYPGPSDMYVPPGNGGPNTVYPQRVRFGT